MSAQALTNFWISLEIMGLGMAGIFVVILVIMLVVVVLTKLTTKKSTGDAQDA